MEQSVEFQGMKITAKDESTLHFDMQKLTPPNDRNTYIQVRDRFIPLSIQGQLHPFEKNMTLKEGGNAFAIIEEVRSAAKSALEAQ